MCAFINTSIFPCVAVRKLSRLLAALYREVRKYLSQSFSRLLSIVVDNAFVPGDMNFNCCQCVHVHCLASITINFMCETFSTKLSVKITGTFPQPFLYYLNTFVSYTYFSNKFLVHSNMAATNSVGELIQHCSYISYVHTLAHQQLHALIYDTSTWFRVYGAIAKHDSQCGLRSIFFIRKISTLFSSILVEFTSCSAVVL